MAETILESTLTCPLCGHVKTETMPTDPWNADETELRRFLRHRARSEVEGDDLLQEVFLLRRAGPTVILIRAASVSGLARHC